MTFDELIQQYNGKGIDWDGYYGYQCFDLAHFYAVKVVGKDIPAKPAAKDLWNVEITGYKKIANTPDGVPQKGDIIIWGTGIGAWGHVAIFVAGNTSSFTSFDQNFPTGSLCHIQQHDYTGVLGWFHPLSSPASDPTEPIKTKDLIDLRRKEEGYDFMCDYLKLDRGSTSGITMKSAVEKLLNDRPSGSNSSQATNEASGGTTPPESSGTPAPTKLPDVHSDPSGGTTNNSDTNNPTTFNPTGTTGPDNDNFSDALPPTTTKGKSSFLGFLHWFQKILSGWK